MKGIIINNISNKYNVKIDNIIYECNARGKLRKDELTPTVGDLVDIEIIEESKKIGVINEIFPRKNYVKRPKISNISQLILVVSSKSPKPDLLMLDKQLVFAEFLNIKPIIVVNKIDLDDTCISEKIKKIYGKIGYTIISSNAKEEIGIEELKKELNHNISVFSGNSGVRKIYIIK